MTTLIAWAAVDDCVTTAVYLASDSRITWGQAPYVWDYCRKLYTLNHYPDVLGFCGDAFFVPQVLSQIVFNMDNRIGFSDNDSAEVKVQKIEDLLRQAIMLYPSQIRFPFDVLYFSISDEQEFVGYKITWRSDGILQRNLLPMRKKSDLIDILGSGKKAFFDIWTKKSIDYEGTSRGIYTCLCDSIKAGKDTGTGGAPQLVGIYRNKQVNTFGVIDEDGNTFLNGMSIISTQAPTIEWRNHLFERCDPNTRKLLERAQAQPRPKNKEKRRKPLP